MPLTYLPVRHEAPVAIALVRERTAAARLAEALRPRAPGQAGAALRVVSRVAELRDALAARPYALVIVEPRDADGAPTEEAVRALRARHPDVPVVGHVAAQPGMSPDVLALARAGVHELVVAGIDDVGVTLRAILTRASRRSTAERVLADVMPLVPLAALPVLRYCLEHTTQAPDVPALARALGVSRQTLATRLRQAGLPGPRALSAWCRLLLAAELLAGEGRPVDEVALTLDFASANAFRNLLRRYADLGPSDVRRDRGASLRAAFHDALTGRRTCPVETTPVHAGVGARDDDLVPS
ncbi:MAG TPA: helix-turn-helix domain-containing protein [Gemmatirosa sp.]